MPIGPLHSGPASNFPPKSNWKDFDHIFEVNKNEMHVAGDTDADVANIKDAVQQVARQTGVEARVIVCIIMQESSGNVGVATTTNQDGSHTGGLMQALGSPGFPGKHGLTQHEITSMVEAGTKHFKGNLNQIGGDHDSAEHIYWALRLYNSGRLDKSNLSNGLGATDSYVSDVANRLTGAQH
ncbi:MAG: hypothetical protein Q9227_001272 [Pyrenula ochraceoflavens]